MGLQTSPGCKCIYCTQAATGVCDRCHSSSCARAIWHGYMCNQEAEERHRTTRRFQTRDNPFNFNVFRGED